MFCKKSSASGSRRRYLGKWVFVKRMALSTSICAPVSELCGSLGIKS